MPFEDVDPIDVVRPATGPYRPVGPWSGSPPTGADDRPPAGLSPRPDAVRRGAAEASRTAVPALRGAGVLRCAKIVPPHAPVLASEGPNTPTTLPKRTRPMFRPLGIVGVIAASSLAACALDAPPAGPGVTVTVAPLTLPGLTDATYTLTVENASGGVVMTRTLTSTRYGAGDGSLSYVAPCDADDNDNTVTLTIDELRGPGASLIDPASWDDPGALSRDFTCVEGADVAVTFDVTVVRAATQGFFDVAVSFDDIFCSAKLDCVDEAGDPLLLLHDASGARARTAVVGLACTGGLGTVETTIYRDALTVSCDGGTAVVDPSAGPGNLSFGAGISGTDGLLFGAAVYAGEEQLGYNKRYWNVLLGIAPTAANCTLTTQATATSGIFDGGATPAGSTWPYIVWDVPLTGAGGVTACAHHPINGEGVEAGVATAYTTGALAFAYSSAPALPPAVDCTVGSSTCDVTSCDQLYRSGVTADGYQVIDPDGAGPLTAIAVWCDMTTAGGGWTVIARAFDVSYTNPPPTIGTGTSGSWAQWAAHSWIDGDSYYVSLDAFAALTAGGATVMQLSRDAVGAVTRQLTYGSFTYDVATNSASIGTCSNLVGTPCSSSYPWAQYGGAAPLFDGYQQPGGGTTNCNINRGSTIFNYHNYSNCVSDSGLFGWTNTSTARPQLLGAYTSFAPENVIMLRPAADGTSCADIHANQPLADSGVYLIDPDGNGAFLVYCDMTPGDAGWTYGLIVDSDTSSDSRARVAGYTTFGAADAPVPGTAYGVDLTGLTFSEVRIDNFTLGTRVSKTAGSTLTWGGTTYTSSTGFPAMLFDLGTGFHLRAGYYGNGCSATNIPVCFTSTSNSQWVCDTDSGYIEGWVDCGGGEVCGSGYYYGKEVWRDAAYTPVCTSYIGAATPALYGFAVR
ncbi:MAG: hypothetical protein EP329_16250 [Deltaproteobacteria bacterium]|nr:MAG: hypothetical protein EP329_16250 [Deltaproteobacteria bacterium]